MKTLHLSKCATPIGAPSLSDPPIYPHTNGKRRLTRDLHTGFSVIWKTFILSMQSQVIWCSTVEWTGVGMMKPTHQPDGVI